MEGGVALSPDGSAPPALEFLGPDTRIRFLHPGFGTGSVSSALLGNVPSCRLGSALGSELGQTASRAAASLCSGELLLPQAAGSGPPFP